MHWSEMKGVLKERFTSRVLAIDSHTAGEPTRLIVGGIPSLPGETMQAKLDYFRTNLDSVRRLLTSEPRGHRDMLAAAVTEPTTEGADFGLIYMDARRYPFLCGHATIGAVTTVIEAGTLRATGPQALITVDTPSGPMQTRARIAEGKVASVTIQMVPSFVYGSNQPLQVPGIGTIQVDTVCVGGFFAMVSADQIGMELNLQNAKKLVQLGMTIIDEANEQLEVRHPLRPEVTTIDVVEFYNPSGHTKRSGENIVVYGEAHMDRSPCGTGTAAKMTLLHHRKQLEVGQSFINANPLGPKFEGRIVCETKVGELPAIVGEVSGSAHITGIHEFVLDPDDPFPQGFLV